MQKPFNAEGLDLTFLFDSSCPEPSPIEVEIIVDPHIMPGFTSEQTSSLQQMFGKALTPLLGPLGRLDQFLKTQSSICGLQSPVSEVPYDPFDSPHAFSQCIHESHITSDDLTDHGNREDNRADTPVKIKRDPGIVRALGVDMASAKRKANVLGETTARAAKKSLIMGKIEKDLLPDLDVKTATMRVEAEAESLLTAHQQTPQPICYYDPVADELVPAFDHSDVSMDEPSTDDAATEEWPFETNESNLQPGPAKSSASDAIPPLGSQTNVPASLTVLFKDEPDTDEASAYPKEVEVCLPLNSKPSEFYNSACARLPSAAKLGCAHIINIGKFLTKHSTPVLKMGDLVATILSNYEPKVLYAFLNINRHSEFRFIRREKPGSARRDFFIERSGLTVQVSNFGIRYKAS